jgi:hypothetical protein
VKGRRDRQGINHVWERREIYKNCTWKEDKKREKRTFKNRPL